MFVLALFAASALSDAYEPKNPIDGLGETLVGACRLVLGLVKVPFMGMNLLIRGDKSPYYPQYENITRRYSNFVNRPDKYSTANPIFPKRNATTASFGRPQPIESTANAPPQPDNVEPKSAEVGAESDNLDDKSDRPAPETGAASPSAEDAAPSVEDVELLVEDAEQDPLLPPEISHGAAYAPVADGDISDEYLGDFDPSEQHSPDIEGLVNISSDYDDGESDGGLGDFVDAVDELADNVSRVITDINEIADDYSSARAARDDGEEESGGFQSPSGVGGDVEKQRLDYQNVTEMQSPFFLTEIAGDQAGTPTRQAGILGRFLSALPNRLSHANIPIPEGGLIYPGVRANITYRSQKAVPISRVIFEPIDSRPFNIKTFVLAAFTNSRSEQYGVSTGRLTLRTDLPGQQQVFNLPTIVEASTVRIIVLDNYGSQDETCFTGVRVVRS